MGSLGASWVIISGVIRGVTIFIVHIRGYITPLITTHEPPSRACIGFLWQRLDVHPRNLTPEPCDAELSEARSDPGHACAAHVVGLAKLKGPLSGLDATDVPAAAGCVCSGCDGVEMRNLLCLYTAFQRPLTCHAEVRKCLPRLRLLCDVEAISTCVIPMLLLFVVASSNTTTLKQARPEALNQCALHVIVLARLMLGRVAMEQTRKKSPRSCFRVQATSSDSAVSMLLLAFSLALTFAHLRCQRLPCLELA